MEQREIHSQISIVPECIPVGCVPSAAVAAGGGGAVSQHPLGKGGCVSQHALGRGDVCPGDVAWEGNICPNACWDTHTPSERND